MSEIRSSFISSPVAYAKNLLVIRRLEFFVVEVTIFGMPILVAMDSFAEFYDLILIEGAVLFFLLYSMGDMINCLADRELDRDYKTRLSDAVFQLGIQHVRDIVIALNIVCVALAVHLSWVADNWGLFWLIAAGMFLGVQYSVGPIRFKSRGVLHLVCLWLLLYFLPMLYAGMLVGYFGPMTVILAASYATLEMGIILVNTSEDLPEDRTEGIRTTTVVLGLKNTITLALTMFVLGGAVFLGLWGSLLFAQGAVVWSVMTFALLCLACLYVLVGLRALARHVHAATSEQEGIARVKAHGKLVPVWATLVGWAGLMCGVTYRLVVAA